MAIQNTNCALGVDIGSTTVKCVLTANGKILFQDYRRHFSKVRQTTVSMLQDMAKAHPDACVSVVLSGSAALGMAQSAGLPFVQEVYATGKIVEKYAPDTSMVIELGGEDAKVIFLDGGMDERMNGTCAGGTGAFIDQMAVLLNMSVAEMDRASLEAQQLYPIASRCGVFAKSDIQPLLNQGAKKSDIAASIYQSVANQTITGLIQGRKIHGKVMFLGGPLYYCDGLKQRFKETLHLTDENAIFPDYALYAVAMGAAACADGQKGCSLNALIESIQKCTHSENAGTGRLPALFSDQKSYREFLERHGRASVPMRSIGDYSGKAWLGVDCGSTTTKLVLIAQDKSILYTYYGSNRGNPVTLVREKLMEIETLCRDSIQICGCSVTGYGEDLILNAFHADEGVVETIAHYTAAKHFQPNVDFILDIGGQDIKCFRIRNGAIDSIMLNEACSSGCGSFVETFATAMGYTVAEFAELGIFAEAPVNLGSRCTVFMNSSVKQSQKDGASVEDISAGLSISVVKNALYKVIRAASPKELGEHIVVQGGTFFNNAVLRAFEREIDANVVRPTIAGLMGAYGAALHIMHSEKSALLSLDELEKFEHHSSSAVCSGCANHCRLTINRFADGGRFISGNQCQRALGKNAGEALPDLYEWKREYMQGLKPVKGCRGAIGIPMALSTYELAPLWHGFFTALGYEVHFSALSNRATYEKGQFSIPSDTVCYPAKIMHGHMEELMQQGISLLFYPELTYNVDEKASDNHYNCPVVAYYAELLNGNMESLRNAKFLFPPLRIENPRALCRTIYPALHELDASVSRKNVLAAAKAGFEKYQNYKQELQKQGEAALRSARARGKRTIILAGRPYHVDPEIGHGIDRLITSLDCAVVSEDSICHLAPVQNVHVLDQWTFRARLYRAAAFAAENPDVELVQLVSFGCGVDAITTDEVRDILERGSKYYTQIKIDEITNLGAVRIRLRSLLGALEERE